MNLHSIASSNISSVNPTILVTVQVCTGYTTNPDGTRTPNYIYRQQIPAQIQALTYNEIRQLDALNIQGIRRAIYLNGQLFGLDRSRGIGGDLIVFPQGLSWPYGTEWLVVLVVEQWPHWTKCACTQQNVSPGGMRGADINVPY